MHNSSLKMLEKNVKTLGGNLAKCTTDLNIKLHCYKRKLEKKTQKRLLITRMAREWCRNSYLLENIGYSTIGKRYWKTIKEKDIDNKTIKENGISKEEETLTDVRTRKISLYKFQIKT